MWSADHNKYITVIHHIIPSEAYIIHELSEQGGRVRPESSHAQVLPLKIYRNVAVELDCSRKETNNKGRLTVQVIIDCFSEPEVTAISKPREDRGIKLLRSFGRSSHSELKVHGDRHLFDTGKSAAPGR